jgi:hypothetical protein
MKQIPFTTYPSFTEDVVLDDVRYTLAFTWNTRGEFWSLSISDVNRTPLVQGIKVVPNYDLLEGFHHLKVPAGAIVALDSSGNLDKIAYGDFSNNRKLSLLYVTEAELAAIRA